MKKIYPFLILLFASPAYSGTAENPCEMIEISQQISQCAAYNKDQSDHLLNLSYKATMDRIQRQYGRDHPLADQYVSLLKKAQREWIKLRDADCRLEAFEIEETTEAHQVTIDNCISKMSNGRASYLKGVAPDL
ncbi:DUF1311 domain-containing protein [Stutzerimonas nosocomialis]|uniref:DUF1311 domain-containing protein n=1 Tax=Stutzerimonas nosocomialis TaxID=1056496 RepID=A0A5R9Q9J8_9GAMM|nr:lysozyme inhibitor LprI family protein [Stutzerimonas nosocomialis]TLX61568.1 DUF1311 domain-containing protein [Stutzerimonas nosocomialis]